MKLYWLAWFLLSFLAFAIPETWALVTGRYSNTLSAAIWDLEQFRPGAVGPLGWTATHVLVGGVLALVLVWLIGHLVFGLWR